MLTSALLAALGLTVGGVQEAPVGTWGDGPMTLQVERDGRFGWAVGDRQTDGEWRAEAALLSMRTPRGEVTYAWRVEGDRLVLTDPKGGELSLRRQRDRRG